MYRSSLPPFSYEGKTWVPVTNTFETNAIVPGTRFALVAFCQDSAPDQHGFYDLFTFYYGEGSDISEPLEVRPTGGTCNQYGYNPDANQII